MIPQQLPPRFVWLKLALELLHADNAGDELDIMLGEKVFVLTLGIFGEEADGGCRRRRESRMRQLARGKSQESHLLVVEFCASFQRAKTKEGNHTHLDRVQAPPGTSRLGVNDDPNMFFAR